MSIHELPQAAVRTIGSSQTLTDPASVVKELIDNAIDARASSVFVEVSANALDVIQVRDTGHGIAPNDRPLVARRHCTSKMRDEKDLMTIGGSYLGFRGEALSSAAEMGAAITITTCIEGEDIATALKIASNGEISAQERASHPVGTTVRVTDFLSKHPVRKEIALKCATKTIDKIKQILRTYAFARPTTRLSLRVLEAKSDRDNWTYAPKAGLDMEETAMKVVGKACASQCAWYEVTSKGLRIQAFVPRSNAEACKIGGVGQYLSVDRRPVSTNRGLFKQVVRSFKADLQRVVGEAALVKEPFMYMAIACPEGSYDPNVEPAKDDVLFEDADVVLAAVQNLLESAY
ncbi:histidine kinase-like ATPase, partial [Delphinella strobiligena]